jgi:hypothetical protein
LSLTNDAGRLTCRHSYIYTVNVAERLQFEWDVANTDHLARHGVKSVEAEQVIANDPLEIESNLRKGELRSVCLGRTDSGRPLSVVYTIRSNRIRVVTAYPMKRKKRKIYESR